MKKKYDIIAKFAFMDEPVITNTEPIDMCEVMEAVKFLFEARCIYGTQEITIRVSDETIVKSEG